MNKQAFKVDMPTVGRSALGGAIAGGSAMALLNLVRKAREMADDRSALLKRPETDEDTIVLTLPAKRGEVCLENKKKPTKVSNTETTKTVTVSGNGSQYRRAMDGTYGSKTAAGWPTLTAATLAGVGGVGVGAHLVNKLYERRREKSLKAELLAAQHEYMAKLQGGKTASVIEDLFPSSLGKEAQSKQFGFFDYPLAAAALMTVLGTGGAAYVTKKILDDRFQEAEQRGSDMPKVRRIVFQTQPNATEKVSGYEPGTQEDLDCVEAALGIMVDKVGSRTLVLEAPYVKKAMADAGTSVIKLMKMAKNTDKLIEYLRGAPDLRRMIQNSYVEQHPTYSKYKFMTKLPGVGRIMDNKLYAAIQNMHGANTDGVKSARPNSISGMFASSLVGSRLGDRGAHPDAIAKAVVKAQGEDEKKKRKPSAADRVSGIQLGAADDESYDYLQKNQERVLELLKHMAATGRI